jgi:ParB family chromosome partitioning protein
MGHARALLALATPGEQLQLRDEILAHEWSVRATEDTVRIATAGRPPRPKQRRRSAEMAALEEALQRALMTRVRIVGSERQGRIEVSYANVEELERIAGLLGARN